VTPIRAPAAVRFTDVDSLGHVNNAAYLDVLIEAALAPLARAGWGVERLGAAGLAPFVAACDLEYLDAARWSDPLDVVTWIVPAPRGLDVLQHVGPAGGDAVSMRARTRWQWHALDGALADVPADLARTIDALAAA